MNSLSIVKESSVAYEGSQIYYLNIAVVRKYTHSWSSAVVTSVGVLRQTCRSGSRCLATLLGSTAGTWSWASGTAIFLAPQACHLSSWPSPWRWAWSCPPCCWPRCGLDRSGRTPIPADQNSSFLPHLYWHADRFSTPRNYQSNSKDIRESIARTHSRSNSTTSCVSESTLVDTVLLGASGTSWCSRWLVHRRWTTDASGTLELNWSLERCTRWAVPGAL